MPRKEKRNAKEKIESIEKHRESADARKYYQTVNWLRKGFQPRLKVCKDNSGKLIEGDEKILEHWAKYFKTQSEKEMTTRRMKKKRKCSKQLNH